MADIRKRTGKKGTTYQVRYPSKSTKSGYAFKTFETLKAAKAFMHSGEMVASVEEPETLTSVSDATNQWLDICEKEGLNGREPVTPYTLQNYRYRARHIKAYDWPAPLQKLTAPNIVQFRSWLLRGNISREMAIKVMVNFQSMMKEMTIRGVLSHNVATGITIRAESRYKEPVSIPAKAEMAALLKAADELAQSNNERLRQAWQRYRPMLYLAADSGMRPQEYLALARSAIKNGGVYINRALDGSETKITVPKTPAGRRFIPLSPDTYEMVKDYADNHAVDNSDDLAFPTSTGAWQERRNWSRSGFKVACKHAGLLNSDGSVKYTLYDLRHFYASMLIECDINLKKIQTLMGHESITTTLNVYGHILKDETCQNPQVSALLRSERI